MMTSGPLSRTLCQEKVFLQSIKVPEIRDKLNKGGQIKQSIKYC